ncbi:MAG TPA: VOC family protein [Candidatus Limnocylindria bacterium]|nr:VOC family protein [Candidatus Limnocylindria bacterium]
MPADRVHHIYIETHNWGKSVAFWRALGFELDEDRGTSGLLRPRAGGPYIYLAEIAGDRTPAVELYLSVTDETPPERPAEVVTPFTATHWGTREMAVRDPDGRLVKLEKHGS